MIGSAATLSTLLLGLAALAQGDSAVHLGRASSVLVAGGLSAFVIAAVFALLCLRPETYGGPTVESLKQIPDLLDDEIPAATAVVIRTQLKMLGQAKASNLRKANRLEGAIGFEVGAAGLLALGAVLVLLGL